MLLFCENPLNTDQNNPPCKKGSMFATWSLPSLPMAKARNTKIGLQE